MDQFANIPFKVKNKDSKAESTTFFFFEIFIVNIEVHTKTRNKPEPPGTSWNYLERAGTIWNELEPPRTSWNYLEPPITIWTQQRTETEKQDIHRIKMYAQCHCPIEYNISNSYCYKEHHLGCLQMEPLGTEWNR